VAEADPWQPIPIPLPKLGGSARFELGPLTLLLCNAGGSPYVIEDRCPHTYISLEGGMITGTTLQCPLHGGELELRDGSPANPPIRRPVRWFPVRQSIAGFEVQIVDA
jgi:nitrite reductase/ring-hydroxylating ferredoxin subunit